MNDLNALRWLERLRHSGTLIFLPLGLTLLAATIGSQLDPGVPQGTAAVLTLGIAAGFAIRFDAKQRSLLLLAAAAIYYVAFGRILSPVFFRFLADLAAYSLPPLVVHFLLEVGRSRHRHVASVGALHLYAPLAAVFGAAFVLRLLWRPTWLDAGGTAAIAVPLIYWLYYAVLLFFVGLGFLNRPAQAPQAAAPASAAQLEDEGKFALAAMHYAKEGRADRSAAMAQRAGDWTRAAEGYRQAGDFFKAAEMYYRAGRLEEALEMYECSGTRAAAARVCLEIGKVDRAAELLEAGGEAEQALQVLEEAGREPSAELCLKAGRHARAVELFRKEGNLVRAAEILEENVGDAEAAARAYLDAGACRKAGELFTVVGKTSEAIDAYLRSPETALRAAQICYEIGDFGRAREILEKHAGEDEQALLLLARICWQQHHVDDVIRILQRLKRQGEPSGTVSHLLGRAFMAKGLPEIAEAELRLALAQPLAPLDDLDARYSLARVLEVLERVPEAIELYHAIIQTDFHYRDSEQRYKYLKSGRSLTPPRGTPLPRRQAKP